MLSPQGLSFIEALLCVLLPMMLCIAVVGAIATVWATKLISTAASKAIDTEQSQQGGGKDSSDAPSS